MAERIFQLLHNASASSANVKIKNAMNPIVKVLLILLPCSVGMILFGGESWIKYLGAVFSFFVVLAVLVAYFYFMVFNPQMLQSEEYQIQCKALEIIQQQGIHGTIELASAPPLPDIHTPQIEENAGGAA